MDNYFLIFLFGLIGGLLPEALALYNLRHDWEKKKPIWVTSKFYWGSTLFMVILGGFTPVLYAFSGIKITAIMAAHLGATTPLLIHTTLKSKPKID